jgi:hypothetical protein
MSVCTAQHSLSNCVTFAVQGNILKMGAQLHQTGSKDQSLSTSKGLLNKVSVSVRWKFCVAVVSSTEQSAVLGAAHRSAHGAALQAHRSAHKHHVKSEHLS